MSKNINRRPKTISRELEENIGEKLYDIGCGNEFFRYNKKVQATKLKREKWDYIRLQNFYASEHTINRVKRQLIGWEKIFASHTSDKRVNIQNK